MSGELRSFTHIVRIAGTDINGNMKLPWALAEIKGIGYSTAMAVIKMLNLNPHMLVGFLTEDEVKRIESVLYDITSLGLPSWMYNRRRDYETNKDRHLIGSDLLLYARKDIEREIRIGSWRGIRHKLGYKVRGQRTRTTGRTGLTVGVTKKKK
ncbi:MAG: 30S ribosomal protein S13 [Acidilobaceae archaeon]